ncbi:hypothetical protein [Chryseobacterium sp. M5A1_1a]
MAKQTANSETIFSSSDKRADKKKDVNIQFGRFGSGKHIHELFWISTINLRNGEVDKLMSLTLEDLKRIAEEAEMLIKIADGDDVSKL